MDYVNGEDRILFIKINGSYLPIGCLTGNTFDESTEMIDTTTRENNGWSTSAPITQSYSIGFSGLQVNSSVVGGNFNVASYDRLCELKRKRLKIEWKIQGSIFPIVDYGKAYISSLGEANNVGEFMSFSGTLTGFGEPLKASLYTTLLNSGNPNEVIQTDNTGLELLRTGQF